MPTDLCNKYLYLYLVPSLLCSIRHTIILDDPFEDPPALEEHIPEASPEPQFEQVGVRGW
jgi:hypothetical protein